MFPRILTETTEKAYFSKQDSVKWFNVPNIAEIYPRLMEEYEKLKKAFNLRKKNEFTSKKSKESNIYKSLPDPPDLRTKSY